MTPHSISILYTALQMGTFFIPEDFKVRSVPFSLQIELGYIRVNFIWDYAY